MYYGRKHPTYDVDKLHPTVDENGKFFDFAIRTGHPVIIDYNLIDREIIVGIIDKGGSYLLGRPKDKRKIESIEEMKKVIKDFISKVHQIEFNIQDYITGANNLLSCPFTLRYKIQADNYVIPEISQFITNQIVFDILFDKYVKDSPQLTLAQYCGKYICYSWDDSVLDYEEEYEKAVSRTKKWMVAAIEREVQKAADDSSYKENSIKLGRDPDLYLGFLGKLNAHFKKSETKPKILWDRLYYNGNRKLITSKQYMRSFNNHNNYSRYDLEKYFTDYDRFVDKTYMQEKEEDGTAYFFAAMDFYFLEIYKRVDFIYKLAVRMENDSTTAIDRENVLVKRFHPEVMWLSMGDNKDRLYYNTYPKHNYYRPLIMLEELWQERELFNHPSLPHVWFDCHFLRAKVYELFNYHCEIALCNYNDIAEFIRKDYNILDYHDPQKVWIQAKDKKRDSEIRIINALKINRALFW